MYVFVATVGMRLYTCVRACVGPTHNQINKPPTYPTTNPTINTHTMHPPTHGTYTHAHRFVCSLGATINMDGSGIYFPCAVVFLAYMSGNSDAVTAGPIVVTHSHTHTHTHTHTLTHARTRARARIHIHKDILPSSFLYPDTIHTTQVLAIVSTLGAVGASPIPNSGIVMILTIWSAVFPELDVPTEIAYVQVLCCSSRDRVMVGVTYTHTCVRTRACTHTHTHIHHRPSTGYLTERLPRSMWQVLYPPVCVCV